MSQSLSFSQPEVFLSLISRERKTEGKEIETVRFDVPRDEGNSSTLESRRLPCEKNEEAALKQQP